MQAIISKKNTINPHSRLTPHPSRLTPHPSLLTPHLSRLILLLILFTQTVSAQIDKKVNHIFIWDVTESMKGVYYDKATGEYKTDKTKDIYNEVQNVLVNVVNGIEENSGDILIIPFKDKVLEDKRFPTTTEGIAQAISYIQNYDNDAITFTNICAAWKHSFNKIKREEKNLIYLLTDGEQSDLSDRNPAWGKGCIKEMVDAYCKLTQNYKFTYTFYISLNTTLSSSIKNAICQSCPENLRCSEGNPPSQIIDIQPNRLTQVVNIQDGELSFTQDFDINGELPTAFRYNALLVFQNNKANTEGVGKNTPDSSPLTSHPSTLIKLKQSKNLSIDNGKTTFELDIPTAMLKKLQKEAPEEMRATIYYTKQDLAQLGINDQIIEFTPNKVELIIRNRREKTLKITVF